MRPPWSGHNDRQQTSHICRTLLQRAGHGDVAAFAELYDRTAPAVYGLILSVLPDAEQAEDVTLEVYVQAWRTASRYDPARADAPCLLMVTARRYLLDRIRTAPSCEGRSGPPRRVRVGRGGS
ncbi:sigma factor [Amycolatopsis sp. NBC_01488]|uniref:sigma factor n=1 Tax=Amycolatopsis sp. NBC_01488 TaxID=2903563 RepID=UPI003FA49D8E